MRRRLHIAYICADRGVPIGGSKGASAHVAELTRALGKRGAELRILAARTAKGVGPEVIDLGLDRSIRRVRQTLLAGAKSAQQKARASEVRALLLNQALGRALARLHKNWRIDAVYERYSLWSYAAAGFATGRRLPYLLEVNAPLRQEQRRYRKLENPAAAATLELYLFASADRLLLPSSALRPYVVRHGARPGRVRVVPNAADPALFRFARRGTSMRPKVAGQFTIGFLGSLKPWHGIDELARAFRLLARRDATYRLLVVGDGPLRRDLESMLRSYGLASLATFTGEVDHDEVPALLARMDVAVAPYPGGNDFYFSPLKLFEYMAAGLPVVASNLGQIAEILRDGRTALLPRPGAIRELAGSIERLRRQPPLAAKLARQARLLLTRRFTWQRNASRVLTMIDNLRRTRRARP